MLVVILICLLLLFVLCFVFTTPLTKDASEDLNENLNEDFQDNESKKRIVSCECEELATWHPGCVQHKMSCPIFRERNPGLTFGEFVKDEGFGYPGSGNADWPPLVMPKEKTTICFSKEKQAIVSLKSNHAGCSA
jgi:hypothetical protein